MVLIIKIKTMMIIKIKIIFKIKIYKILIKNKNIIHEYSKNLYNKNKLVFIKIIMKFK